MAWTLIKTWWNWELGKFVFSGMTLFQTNIVWHFNNMFVLYSIGLAMFGHWPLASQVISDEVGNWWPCERTRHFCETGMHLHTDIHDIHSRSIGTQTFTVHRHTYVHISIHTHMHHSYIIQYHYHTYPLELPRLSMCHNHQIGIDYMSDGFYLVKWRVILGRTPVCRKHHN